MGSIDELFVNLTMPFRGTACCMRLSKYRIENWTWVGQRTRWRASCGVQSSKPSMTVPLMVTDRPSLLHRAEIRGGQPVELFFDGLDGAPAHVEAEGALHESREAVFELNVGDCVRRASAFRW